MIELRKCKTCFVTKNIIDFATYKDKSKNKRYLFKCKACKREYFNTYFREKLYLLNKEDIDNKNKKYNAEHQSELKKYRAEYRKKNKTNIAKKTKDKRNGDLSLKLRSNISSNINQSIKKSNSSKGGNSCLKHLEYSMEDLKKHLEDNFESWMTWENYGRYNAKWDDNDELTWTWNIDHIIPQSDLAYTDMDDENFKKCWGLENLRPFSSKKNLIDGSSRIRHRK
jgi:hypothetical protein